MNDANNISQAERKEQFVDAMAELQKIAELTSKSMQLQTEIIDLLKSDDPLTCVKIEELKNEHRMLNEKINTLKNALDEKYPQ